MNKKENKTITVYGMLICLLMLSNYIDIQERLDNIFIRYKNDQFKLNYKNGVATFKNLIEIIPNQILTIVESDEKHVILETANIDDYILFTLNSL